MQTRERRKGRVAINSEETREPRGKEKYVSAPPPISARGIARKEEGGDHIAKKVGFIAIIGTASRCRIPSEGRKREGLRV